MSASTSTPTKALLSVTEIEGDLFAAPRGSILIHACNSQGSWGAGIAATFKERYPAAFAKAKNHCSGFKGSRSHLLDGTAMLVSPLPDDERQHWIGCIYTSNRYGKAADGKERVLENTETSMRDLMTQVAGLGRRGRGLEVRMCRINSGLFRVPWDETKAVLEGMEDRDGLGMYEVVVVELPKAQSQPGLSG